MRKREHTRNIANVIAIINHQILRWLIEVQIATLVYYLNEKVREHQNPSVWGSKSLGSRNFSPKDLWATKSVCRALSLSSVILQRIQDDPGLQKGGFSILPSSRRKREDWLGIPFGVIINYSRRELILCMYVCMYVGHCFI